MSSENNMVSSLMARLTDDEATPGGETSNGTTGATANVDSHDLFGDIPIDANADANADADAGTHGNAGNVASIIQQVEEEHETKPRAASSSSSSLLASSGLLMPDNNRTSNVNGGGSGLFEHVDELERHQEQQERDKQLCQLKEEQQEKDKQGQQQGQQQQQWPHQEQHQASAHQPNYTNVPLSFPPQPPSMHSTQSMALEHQQHQQLQHQLQPPLQQPGESTYYHSTTGGAAQSHTVAPVAQGRYTTTSTPSVMAGLHNTGIHNTSISKRELTVPPSVIPVYGEIQVFDPMLEQGVGMLGFSSPPHWTYQVTTGLLEGGVWIVRRRFRHIVALEDRLMQDCPGAILPPRPEKHATRAIEEASSTQSTEFALRRTRELQIYLNLLAMHPVCSKSQVLRLFLALQDDVGTAWPEVSPNAFTRFGSVTQGVASKMADNLTGATSGGGVASLHMEGVANMHTGTSVGEDNAELIALVNTESLRMGAVLQAVPKLEGCVMLLGEEGDKGGAAGMEINKLSKDVDASDRELSLSLEVISQGLLRAARRSKQLSQELRTAMTPYVYQYKLCHYEKAAFEARRHALAKRQKERSKADSRAQRLAVLQRSSLHPVNNHGITAYPNQMDQMEIQATISDEMAVGAINDCKDIGDRLKTEVNRVAFTRRADWSKSMKIIAAAMKEASSERVAIWESTRTSFLQAFPEYLDSNAAIE